MINLLASTTRTRLTIRLFVTILRARSWVDGDYDCASAAQSGAY
jgi:hypothetical protein